MKLIIVKKNGIFGARLMFKPRNLLFISVLVLLLTISCVGAVEDNITNGGDLNLEYCDIAEVISQDSGDNAVEFENNDILMDNETIDGEYVDPSEAYEYLNEFRAENGVWCWNSDDVTITYYNTNENNKLQSYVIDADLEQTAKIRAKELSQLFSHTRPDGSDCVTAYPKDIGSCGENIMIGTSTGKTTIDSWKEFYNSCKGQGHRRNMLNPYFNCVGIAGYKYDGGFFWVLSVGKRKNMSINNTVVQNQTSSDVSKATFADLNDLIENNVNIKLEKDYAYCNDSSFKEGIVIEKSLTVDGQGHTIDAKKLARVFNITADNVVLKNIKFINGYADYGYGAVYSSSNNVTVINCSFTNNFAYYGSALSSTDGDMSVVDCSFFDNMGIEGCIYSNNSNLQIFNCNFVDNNVILQGASLSLRNSDIYIADSDFSNNSAFRGGAVYLNNCKGSLINCSLMDNSVLFEGGSMYLVDGNVSLQDCRFINNYINSNATAKGGSVFLSEGTISIVNCSFINNSIISEYSVEGSAMFLSGGIISIADCNIIDNYLKSDYYYRDGGAIYLTGCKGFVEDCRFVSNVAENNYGAAIFSNDNNITVVNCSFKNNMAKDDYGGAIYLKKSNFTVKNCSFTNNVAYFGGSIYSDEGIISIVGCRFINNSVSSSYSAWGAAVYLSKSIASISYTNFIDNFVDARYYSPGGVIYSSYYSNISLKGCSFINNSAYYGGALYLKDGIASAVNCSFINNNQYYGAVYSSYTSVNLFDCLFMDNEAYSGSTLYLSGGNVTVVNSDFVNNHADYNGGAVYLSDCNVTVVNSDFVNNHADYGGAVYLSDCNGTVLESSFENNAAQYGGAAYNCNAINCTFRQNHAYSIAGAIYGMGNIVSDCRFINNTAFYYNPTYNVTTIKCSFTGNRILKKAQFIMDNLKSKYVQGEKLPAYLYSSGFEYISNATVTLRAYKDDRLVNTFNFLSGDGWIVNIAEGEYAFEFNVENQDYIVEPVNVTLTVIKKEITNVNVGNNTYGEPTIVDMISNVDGSVKVSIDNTYTKNVNVVANKSSKITFTDIPAGKHTLKVTITPKSTKIDKKKFTKDFTVFKKETSISLEVKNTTNAKNVIVNVLASENGNVSVKIGRTAKSINVKANVKTKLDFGILDGGLYTITATFKAGENYIDSTDSKAVKIFNEIKQDAVKISIPQNRSDDFEINLPGDAGGKVSINIAGKNCDVDVVGGVAVVKLPNLTKGVYEYLINYSGDDKYVPFNVSGSFNVNSIGTIEETVTINPDIEIPSLDNGGEVKLPSDATGTVTLTINNENYTFDVENGIANVTLPNLADGDYPYTIKYSGDGKYSSFTNAGSLKVNKTNSGNASKENATVVDHSKITASNKKVTYQTGKYYRIKVYGKDGKLADGVKVVIMVKGKTFKTLTTKDGVAKFKVTQKPGTYKMNINALGNSVSKTLTVKHLLTLKSATVKKSAKKLTLQATLGKVNGKYLKAKKITFKFNGKKYAAKTNSKGVAKVTIKSDVLKKLKVGKKVTYQATYLKDTVKQTVKIKK